MVIIWLNGAFGAGKTTVGGLLSQRSPRVRLFDPESVGYMLRANLRDYPVPDFRHWESWQVLTPIVADEVIRFSGQSLVAPQTVLEEGIWDVLAHGLTVRGHDVLHVLLEADEDAIRRRIDADGVEVAAKAWRVEHVPRFADARPWLGNRADLIVDTTELSAGQVADRIWEAARDRVT